jgi:predicted ATPase
MQMMEAHRDGVWLVELAPISNPAYVAQTFIAALGLSEPRDDSPSLALTKFLRAKHILLIIDNCEHVLSETAKLIQEILLVCIHIRVIATSREILNIPGEVRFRVPSLSLSDSTDFQSESVQLFMDRAKTALPTFELTKDNASVVAQICSRLDGIPLAIELAAARITALSVQQIAARLEYSFQLLTGGAKSLPHHRTLDAAIEWSYNLLAEAERVLLHRLSVFAGGWTLEAAESVTSDPSLLFSNQVFDLISQLVNKSLVIVDFQARGETRYHLLETVREYARARLHEAGEVVQTRKQHFDFFYILAQHIGSKVFGPEKGVWINRAEADIDNFRAALSWSLEADPAGVLPPLTERAEKAIQLLVSLLDFYWARGYSVEAREWLGRLLVVDMSPSSIRAMGFQKAGWLTRATGEFEKAKVLLNQALAMAREIGDKYRIAMSLSDLGLLERDQGNSVQSIDHFSEARSLFLEIEDSEGIGNSLYYLAEMHMLNRDLETARQLWEEGLGLFRKEGDKPHIAWGLEGLGDVAFLEGELAQAAALQWESLEYKSEVGDKFGIAFSFAALAQVAAAQQRPERAAVLWGAAEQLRHALNTPLDPSRQNFYISLIPMARDKMGHEAFEAAWAKGQGLMLEQAIEYALARADE